MTDTTRIYIELPDKDPDDVLDYQIDFTDAIPAPFVLDGIDSGSVVIEAAGDGSDPTVLEVFDVSAIEPTCGDSGGRSTAVLFWLRGGTSGVRYRGRVAVSDNSGGSPTDRQLVRRFYIKVQA